MGSFSKQTILNPSQPRITNNSTIAATSISNNGNQRTNIVESLTNSSINRITDNPFYFFNNLSMTKVTFYNINKEHTTLDEVIDNAYNFIGPASGFRFDKINGVILYGIQNMELSIDMGEWGAEADPIEGEAYLPPNTFIPYQHSYFSIDYINKSGREVLFRVTSVNIDTFPNGSNFYKISYKLESIGENINPQVINEYQYMADNIGKSGTGPNTSSSGSNNNVLVDMNTFNLMNSYNQLIEMLKQAYVELFFQQSTQTFVFKYGFWDYFFYDPYLIEFLIRHKIFSVSRVPYIHVSQPALPPMYLHIDYNKTIFRLLEDPVNTTVCYYDGYGMLVQDPMSLLTHRIEPYYMITYRDDDGSSFGSPLLEKIPLFDTDMINLLPGYSNEDPKNSSCPCGCSCQDILAKLPNYKKYYKIIYNYFAGLPITYTMITDINNIDFKPCKELYYAIPMLIYILQQTINNLPSTSSSNTSMEDPSSQKSNGSPGNLSLRSCPKGCLTCTDKPSD